MYEHVAPHNDAWSVQAVVTNTVILRGHYQTLPVALYGWTIASDDEQRAAAPVSGELAFSFQWEAPETATQPFAGLHPDMTSADNLFAVHGTLRRVRWEVGNEADCVQGCHFLKSCQSMLWRL